MFPLLCHFRRERANSLTCLARKYSACFCDRGPLLGLSFLKQNNG